MRRGGAWQPAGAVRTVVCASLLLCPTVLRAADLFLGTWVLEPARSQYAAGTCPKSMTIEMTAAARGVHYHSVTRLVNGSSFEADYTANYDGVPSMVTGAKGVLLPVSLARVGPREVIARYTSGMEVRATSRRTVSADGQTMTVTTTSGDGAGGRFTNVGVYRRLQPGESLHRLLTEAHVDLNGR